MGSRVGSLHAGGRDAVGWRGAFRCMAADPHVRCRGASCPTLCGPNPRQVTPARRQTIWARCTPVSKAGSCQPVPCDLAAELCAVRGPTGLRHKAEGWRLTAGGPAAYGRPPHPSPNTEVEPLLRSSGACCLAPACARPHQEALLARQRGDHQSASRLHHTFVPLVLVSQCPCRRASVPPPTEHTFRSAAGSR